MLARKGDAATSNCVLGKNSRAATGAPRPSPSLTRFVSVGQVNARLDCVSVYVCAFVCVLARLCAVQEQVAAYLCWCCGVSVSAAGVRVCVRCAVVLMSALFPSRRRREHTGELLVQYAATVAATTAIAAVMLATKL